MSTRRTHTIYRCASKPCGRVVRVAFEVESRPGYTGPNGQRVPSLVLSVKVASVLPAGVRLDPRGGAREPALVCSCPRGATGEVMRAATIVGRFSAAHKCGARCLASTGPSCECSCGGANHGSAHGG